MFKTIKSIIQPAKHLPNIPILIQNDFFLNFLAPSKIKYIQRKTIRIAPPSVKLYVFSNKIDNLRRIKKKMW